MKDINLNIDHWSMVSDSDHSEAIAHITDVIAMADYISSANNDDDALEINMREYTH